MSPPFSGPISSSLDCAIAAGISNVHSSRHMLRRDLWTEAIRTSGNIPRRLSVQKYSIQSSFRLTALSPTSGLNKESKFSPHSVDGQSVVDWSLLCPQFCPVLKRRDQLFHFLKPCGFLPVHSSEPSFLVVASALSTGFRFNRKILVPALVLCER